ncbi:MAG: hypothetical protein LRY68_05185 [Sulfurospirillum sp.]|nr:hypothetical protein [Sulfurospirillum sp.]
MGTLKNIGKKLKAFYEDVGKHCGFTRVQLVSEDTASNVIPTTIIKNIFENDIVICDVSGKNPNVMFELGIRIAFDKPVVITKDDKTKISFDIASLKYLGYPQSQHYGQMQTFKETLAKSLQATLKESPSYLQSFGINYSRCTIMMKLF